MPSESTLVLHSQWKQSHIILADIKNLLYLLACIVRVQPRYAPER
jgi:hypothetical protein